MFDGMRYVPIVLRGEVVLLKEVPEEDLASSTCASSYGRRTRFGDDGSARSKATARSRGSGYGQASPARAGRRASGDGASGSALSDSDSDESDESVSLATDDPASEAETPAARKERLHHEFFAEIAAAASRRALRRLLYKSTRDRHSISRSKQLGLCAVGPGGCVLELAMLNAAYESASNPMTDWSDSTFFGQKHGCTVITTMRTEVGWISRYFFHSLITANAPFMKDISEWALSLPTSRSIRDMLVTQEMWKNFRSNLVEDILAVSPRASNRDRASRARGELAPVNGTAVSKRVALGCRLQ